MSKTIRPLMNAINKIIGVYYLFAKKESTNENELMVLYALCDKNKSYTQKTLSEEWLIPKTTINTVVKQLIKKELISFYFKDNKKDKYLSLTEKGKGHANVIFKDIHSAEQTAIMQTIEKYSFDFITALEEYSDNLHQAYGQIQSEKKAYKSKMSDLTQAWNTDRLGH